MSLNNKLMNNFFIVLISKEKKMKVNFKKERKNA